MSGLLHAMVPSAPSGRQACALLLLQALDALGQAPTPTPAERAAAEQIRQALRELLIDFGPSPDPTGAPA